LLIFYEYKITLGVRSTATIVTWTIYPIVSLNIGNSLLLDKLENDWIFSGLNLITYLGYIRCSLHLEVKVCSISLDIYGV